VELLTPTAFFRQIIGGRRVVSDPEMDDPLWAIGQIAAGSGVWDCLWKLFARFC